MLSLAAQQVCVRTVCGYNDGHAVCRSEAVSDELQMRLKITDDKLKRTEMKLQELSAAKVHPCDVF